MSLKFKISILLVAIVFSSCSSNDDSNNDDQDNTVGIPSLDLNLTDGDFNGTYTFEDFTFYSGTSYIGSIDSGLNENTANVTVFYSLVITDLSQLRENQAINYNTVELFLNINDVGYRGFSGGITLTRFRLAPSSYGENVYVADGNFNFETTNDSMTNNTTASGEFKNILIECSVCINN